MVKKSTSSPEVNAVVASGSSPSSAIPFGTSIKIPIIPGYGPAPRLGDLEMVITEVVRGSKAQAQIKELGAALKPPKSGSEYLLMKVKLDYSRSGTIIARDAPYKLTEGQFVISNPDGVEFTLVSSQPDKSLIGSTMAPGDTKDGWLLFQLPADEKKPFLLFRRANVDNVWGNWSDIWFKLVKE